MKKLLLFAAATLLIVSCGKKEFSITATFDKSDLDGKTAYLVNSDTSDTIDSVVIKNKCLQINGVADTAYMGRLIVDNSRMTFVVENGNIAIDWKDKKATGTELNTKMNVIENSLDSLETLSETYSQELNAGKMTEAEVQKKDSVITLDLVNIYEKAYKENLDNPIGAWAFTSYAYYKDLSLEQIEAVIKDAPTSFKNKTRIQKTIIAAKQKIATAEGQMFTDFTIKSDDGIDKKLSSVVGKGNIVLVDFWASWCGPCRAEMSNIKEIYNKYNGKGFSVLGVAVWDKPMDTKAAISSLQLPWTVFANAQSIPTDIYGITAIPHIIIFGPDGKILSRGLQGEALKAKVDELMSAKK